MAYKKKVTVNGKRSIEQEVKSDSQAKNLLTVKSSNYENSKDSPRGPKAKISKKSTQLALLAKAKKVKKQRVYTEKELGIPKLNKSIDPEGIKKPRGKKGKVFADKNAMLRILHTVNEQLDSKNASKLEKARQLEEIRETKRKEMELKEQEKEEKLTKKKSELKKRKRKDTKKPEAEKEPLGQKKVSFA
ncbi:Loc1p [Sugiyamaella lignohabitans]|uniref:60S ribosomal subunit assembly/export protein LOC1 n=1 Tax=Sugiyamaella lignohabitans TaxID=796027 RepID=A0A167FH86_9ASCO|nr:Loc1p [Sugiyamaella lignohabitans]ANB15294.1 Loc1p [Sugiyamaella lignohabitans]